MAGMSAAWTVLMAIALSYFYFYIISVVRADTAALGLRGRVVDAVASALAAVALAFSTPTVFAVKASLPGEEYYVIPVGSWWFSAARYLALPLAAVASALAAVVAVVAARGLRVWVMRPQIYLRAAATAFILAVYLYASAYLLAGSYIIAGHATEAHGLHVLPINAENATQNPEELQLPLAIIATSRLFLTIVLVAFAVVLVGSIMAGTGEQRSRNKRA